eukprot:81358_1
MNVFDVGKNEKIFDLFVQHLIQEFSLEIMLSLIEATQFMITVGDFAKTLDNYSENDWCLSFEAVYPMTVPKSSILIDELGDSEMEKCQNMDDDIKSNLMEFVIRCRKLFDKYVKYGA